MFSTPQAAAAPPAKAALPPLQGATGKPACARRLEPSQPEAPARQHAAGVSVLAVCSLLLLCPTGFGPIVWGPFSAAFFLAPASKEVALQLDPERGGAAAVKTADEMAAEAESLRKVHAEEADPVDYKTAEHAAGCAATEGATPDAAPEGFTPAALLFDVFAGGTSTSAGGGCPAFSVGDRVIRSRDGTEGTVETVEPDGKIKVRAADGSLLNRATSSSWRLSHSEDGTGPKPAPNDEWPKEGTHAFRTLRGVECLLDPMRGEEAQMWKLLIDKEIMKPFEEALDDFSLWRGAAGYVSRTIEGVAILSNHNEDAVAAIGPDSRANAAGAESWLLRVEKIPKLGELVVKHDLRALNEQVRIMLPSGKSRFAGFRQKYWHLGDMLRLADRWMRFAQKYTMLEVENARARCTFGKEGTISAALGPHYKKQDKKASRAGSREQGRAAREPWKMMYGKPSGQGRPGTNVENVIAKTFILRIFNQDPTMVRMELKGEGLSYNRHMLHATDPKTIMGFARVFYMSLHGEAPTGTWLNNLRKNLRNNANSALFEGYGWEMEFGGQKWEKN